MKLSELIGRELAESDERDPGVVASRLAMRLSAKDARVLLASLLRDPVRLAMNTSRRTAMRSASRTGGVGPSKWERHRPLTDHGILVADAYKRFGDLTAEDFDWLADDRERRGAELVACASEYRGYAAQMRAAGVRTFGELSERTLVAA